MTTLCKGNETAMTARWFLPGFGCRTTFPKLFWAAAFVFTSFTAFSQISGPTSACSNVSITYSYDDGNSYIVPNWTITNGSVISTYTDGGTYYSATVQWSAGAGTLTFKWKTHFVASISVTGYDPPTAYTAGGGGTICDSGSVSVTLSGSQSGVTYQLYKVSGNVPWQSPVSGTGSALSWTITNGNVYMVRGYYSYTGCSAVDMNGTSTVIFDNSPTAYSVGGGGSYCSGGSGVTVTLSGSGLNVNYQLKVNGSNSGSAVAGTGSSLSWTAQTTGGTYTIVGTRTSSGCSATMSGSATVTVSSLPTAYSVGGGGTYCSGGSGVTVSLSGSQSGVNYQLKVNGSNSGSAIAGTGSALNWNSQTSAGTYTIVATNTSTSCTNTMTGSATVTINSAPDVYTVSGGGTACVAGPGVTVSLSFSVHNISYQLKINGVPSGSTRDGNAGTLSWTGQTAPGTYTVTATINATGCSIDMSGSATVTNSPTVLPVSVTDAGLYCTGGSGVTISISSTQSSVSYQLYLGASAVGSALNGTGGTIHWYSVTTTGTYSVKATDGANCTANMNGTPVVSTTAPVISGSSTPLYGNPVTLSTGSYLTYQWKDNGANISGATSQSWFVDRLGSITVEVTSGSFSGVCSSSPLLVATPQQAVRANYVSTTSILKSGVTPSTNMFALNPQDLAQGITYLDGLGRTFQSVGVGLSANQTDIVSAQATILKGTRDSTFLPFVTGSKGGGMKLTAIRNASNFRYAGSDQQNFYSATSRVASDSSPFSATDHSPAPDLHALKQYAPGSVWQSHRMMDSLNLNNAGIIHYWKPNGTTRVRYAARTLMISIITDENGNKVKTYTDSRGLTVLKQVRLDETIGSMVHWLDTYYIYDAAGRVIYQLPPKAMNLLGAGDSLDAYNSSIADLIYKYTYDTKGRLVEKKVPGAALQSIIYDNLDRVVLTQDGNLAAGNQWMFVKYDNLHRPVYSGLYVNTTQTTRSDVQALFDAKNYPTDPWYESETSGGNQGYTNNVFPTSGLTVLSATFYDHYDFDRNGSADYSYDNSHLSGLPSAASTFTRNMPTGSKKLVMGTSTWLVSAVFYDNFDRALQTQSNNHLNTSVQDKSSILYNDIAGHISKTKVTHSGGTTVNIVQRYTYDPNWRTLGIYHTIDNGSEQQLASYSYNALGQMVDKKLHNTGGSSFMQSVDYRYNIRGWLSSINNAQLTNDGTLNDDTGDYFGMEVLREAADSGIGSAAQYNGNISAMKWKTLGESAGTAGQRSYKYIYDKSDKLKSATFQAYGTNAWNKETNTLNENMRYDHNGNILSLTRKNNQRGLSGMSITSTAQTIDTLTYTYATGNQMSKVEDLGTTAGFNNGSNTTTEYTYSTYGSLTADKNKGIDSIKYNELGKVKRVKFSDGHFMTYVYDAAGTKLTVKNYNTSGTLTTTTDYVGAFVYQNSALSFFSSPEGRVVKNGSNYEYQYAIADHQGNTRVLFTSATPAPLVLTATFEGDSNDNSSSFSNVNSNNVVYFTAANHTSGGSTVVRLNQNYSVGPSKSLKVYAGDKIDAEVWTYYEPSTGYGTSNAGTTAMITAIAGAFGGVSGGGGESGSIYNGVNSAIGGWGLGPNQGDSQPAAYLNYILFDQSYKVMTMGWRRVHAGPFTKDSVSMSNITVKEAGYIFVYLSYEDQSNNYVQFDDFKITHTKSNLVQANEYYPFGMQAANSWTRENTTGNNFLGNGGTELNTTSNLYDLEYRNYDPALARMHQVDPMTDSYSSLTPYNYSFNSPGMFNDRNGADPNLGDPDHVTRRGINQPGNPVYYNPETSTSDFGMRTSDFLSQGLHSTISQWAPDFYGPVLAGFVGEGDERRAVFDLPTHIEEAGGVEEYMKQFANSQGNTTKAYASDAERIRNKFEWLRKSDKTGNKAFKAIGKGNKISWTVDAEAANDGETWYYVLQDAHSLAYRPSTNTLYEINHPTFKINGEDVVVDGKISWALGQRKSQVYRWKMSDEGVAEKFWNFRDRPNLILAPVYVANPSAAVAFFESNIGGEYPYHVTNNNCQNYVFNGLGAGQAEITFPFLFIGRWNNPATSPTILGKH